ncbi:MAG: PIN domain-containing protein [Planctomycetia bacterium]|mgnify:CR=1 FL=1|nr:PIN domain-containing protein [Planctomycetia bacterium]
MAVRLLISDANIIIDMDTGGLLRLMFRFDATFAVPDVLYEEELRADHPELLRLGLKRLELSEGTVVYAGRLVEKYRGLGASINDLLALALARQEECPLLTGDGRLRTAGRTEGIDVHGTLWLIEQMIRARTITVRQAGAAYAKMRDAGRRLPWDDVDQQLRTLR